MTLPIAFAWRRNDFSDTKQIIFRRQGKRYTPLDRPFPGLLVVVYVITTTEQVSEIGAREHTTYRAMIGGKSFRYMSQHHTRPQAALDEAANYHKRRWETEERKAEVT